MIPESLTLATKGFFLIMGASAINLYTSVTQFVGQVPAEVGSIESLGTHGLLVLGIVYLYRANQKLESDIRKIHEDQKSSGKEQLEALKDELKESRDSRDRLYDAIKGTLAATKNSNE